jgi:hypothetical protein
MLIGACSQLSGKTHSMEIDVSEKQIALWREGALIQDVMPNLSPDEREFIMTGITPDEWAAEFGEESNDGT